MNLKFTKNEDNEILVALIEENSSSEFKYVEMIKNLIKGQRLEETEICGDFNKDEIESINRMVELINKEVDNYEKLETTVPID